MRRIGVPACLAVVLMVAAGCGEDVVFEDIEKKSQSITDFEGFEFPGQARLEFTVAVGAELNHAEIDARWSSLNREVDIELYILRDEDYNPDLHPSLLERVYWSSAPTDGVPFGPRRITQVAKELPPGTWRLVFYNPERVTPSTETELSARVALTYFE